MLTRSKTLSGAALGALVGVFLTAALIALLYLADQAAGLPLVMYDLFDWLARVLPGDVITRVIGLMVDAIERSDVGETSSTAKTIENGMAIFTFFIGGVITSALLYVVLRRYDVQLTGAASYLPGVLAAAIIAVPMILISRDVNITATAPESASTIWLAAAFLVWGALVSWAYYQLYPLRPVSTYGEGEQAAVDILSPRVERFGGEVFSAEPISRRQFLIRVGAASATVTFAGVGIGRYLKYRDDQAYEDLIESRRAAAESMPTGLPNAGDPVEPVPGTRPEYTPLEDHYRIDINSRSPEINGDDWRLQIAGLVGTPLALSLDDLRTRYEPRNQYVTLACISNRIGGDLTSTTRWTGASLRDVLADAQLEPAATHLKITSEDGFYETVALELIEADERIMLTYDWDGIPLLYEHGFPLRIYIPDLFGMKQPKWITDIEVMDHDEDGYWVVRGWDKVAQMRTTSVVDVVGDDMPIERDGRVYIPVGGIAHAGARGISKVEVSVDEGDWQEAELRAPLSETTWVIWRYEWPFEAGKHTFAVRCTEGDGTPQITESNPNMPSGATGTHKRTREL